MAWYDEPNKKVDKKYATNQQLADTLRDRGITVRTAPAGSSADILRGRTVPARPTSTPARPTQPAQRSTGTRSTNNVIRAVPTRPVQDGETYYTPTNQALVNELFQRGVDLNNLRRGNYNPVFPQEVYRPTATAATQGGTPLQPRAVTQTTLQGGQSAGADVLRGAYNQVPPTRGAPAQPGYIPTQSTYDTASRGQQTNQVTPAPRLRSPIPPSGQVPTADILRGPYNAPAPTNNSLRPAADMMDLSIDRVDTGPAAFTGQQQQAPTTGSALPDQPYGPRPYERDDFVGDNVAKLWQTTWERIQQDWGDVSNTGRMNFFPINQYQQELEQQAAPDRANNDRIVQRAFELRQAAFANTPKDYYGMPRVPGDMPLQPFVDTAQQEMGMDINNDLPGPAANALALGKGIAGNVGQVPMVGSWSNLFGNTLGTLGETIGAVTRMPMQLAVPVNPEDPTKLWTADEKDLGFITVGQRIGVLTDVLLNPSEWLSPSWSNGTNPITAFDQARIKRETELVDNVYGLGPQIGETYINDAATLAERDRRATANVVLDFSGSNAALEYVSLSGNRQQKINELRTIARGAYAASQNMNYTPEEQANYALTAAQLELQIKHIEGASEQELADMFLLPIRDAVLATVTDITLLKDVQHWISNRGKGIAYTGTAANPNRRRLMASLELAQKADDEVATIAREIAGNEPAVRTAAQRLLEGGLSVVNHEQKQTKAALTTLFSAVTNREDIPTILRAIGNDLEEVVTRGIPVSQLHSTELWALAENGYVRIPEADALLLQESANAIVSNLNKYADQWQNLLSLKNPKATINQIMDEVLRATELASAERNGVLKLTNAPPLGTSELRLATKSNAAGDVIHVIEYVDKDGTVLHRSPWGSLPMAEREIAVYNEAVKKGEFLHVNYLDAFTDFARRSVSVPLIYTRPGSWVRNALGAWLTGVSTATNTMIPVDDVLAFVERQYPAGTPYEYLQRGTTSKMFDARLGGKNPISQFVNWASSVRGGHTEIKGTNVSFGENAFKAKTWYKGAQDLSRTAIDTLWRSSIEPALVQMNVPGSTRRFIESNMRQLAKDWDINRFVDQVTNHAQGRVKHVDIASIGRHYAEVLPAAAKSLIDDLALKAATPEELTTAIQTVVDREIEKLTQIAGYDSAYATLPVNLDAELAEALKQVSDAGQRVVAQGGDATALVTTQQQLKAIQDGISRIYMLASKARNSESVKIISNYYRDISVARRDVYMVLDDLSRQLKASPGNEVLKAEYEGLRLRYWNEWGNYATQRGQETIVELMGLDAGRTGFDVGAVDAAREADLMAAPPPTITGYVPDTTLPEITPAEMAAEYKASAMETRAQIRAEWDRVAKANGLGNRIDQVVATYVRGGIANVPENAFEDLYGSTIAGIPINNQNDVDRLIQQYYDLGQQKLQLSIFENPELYETGNEAAGAAPRPTTEAGQAMAAISGGIGDGMRATYADSVARTGKLPSAEVQANSLLNQVYERLVAQGAPRDQSTLDTALELNRQAGGEASRMGQIFTEYRQRTGAAAPFDFAAAVNQAAAKSVPAIGNNVFISDVYDQFVADNPTVNMTLDEFKAQLAKERTAGTVTLVRADMGYALNQDAVAASTIKDTVGEVQFVQQSPDLAPAPVPSSIRTPDAAGRAAMRESIDTTGKLPQVEQDANTLLHQAFEQLVADGAPRTSETFDTAYDLVAEAGNNAAKLGQTYADYRRLMDTTQQLPQWAAEQTKAIEQATADIEKVAQKYSIQPQQVETEVTDFLRKSFADYPIAHQTQAENIDRVLDTGELQNQIQTGTSPNTPDIDQRLALEARKLNIPIDAPGEQRPIYGYLFMDRGEQAWMDGYGEIAFVFDDSVKSRSTFLVGDDGATVAAPLNAPTKEAIGFHYGNLYDMAKGTAGFNELDMPYIEFQIRDGVKLSDVKEVLDRNSMLTPEQVQRFNDLGIPVRQGDQVVPAEVLMRQQLRSGLNAAAAEVAALPPDPVTPTRAEYGRVARNTLERWEPDPNPIIPSDLALVPMIVEQKAPGVFVPTANQVTGELMDGEYIPSLVVQDGDAIYRQIELMVNEDVLAENAEVLAAVAGDMTTREYYRVPVANITGVTNTQNFPDALIEDMAQAIVASNGTAAMPVIVVSRGMDAATFEPLYDFVSNELVALAAQRAGEIDPRAGEYINAFVVQGETANIKASMDELYNTIMPEYTERAAAAPAAPTAAVRPAVTFSEPVRPAAPAPQPAAAAPAVEAPKNLGASAGNAPAVQTAIRQPAVNIGDNLTLTKDNSTATINQVGQTRTDNSLTKYTDFTYKRADGSTGKGTLTVYFDGKSTMMTQNDFSAINVTDKERIANLGAAAPATPPAAVPAAATPAAPAPAAPAKQYDPATITRLDKLTPQAQLDAYRTAQQYEALGSTSLADYVAKNGAEPHFPDGMKAQKSGSRDYVAAYPSLVQDPLTAAAPTAAPAPTAPAAGATPQLFTSDQASYAEWQDLTGTDFSKFRGNLFGQNKTDAINSFRQVKEMHWQAFYDAAEASGDTRAMEIMIQTQQDISRLTAETKAKLAPLREKLAELGAKPGALDKGTKAWAARRKAAVAYYTQQANLEYDLAVATSAKIQAATAYVQAFPEPVTFRHPVYGDVTIIAVRDDKAAVRINGGRMATIPASELDADTMGAVKAWQERIKDLPNSVDKVKIAGMNAALDGEIKAQAKGYLDDLITSRERAGIAETGVTSSTADSILLLNGLRERAPEVAKTAFETTGGQMDPRQLNAVLDSANTVRKQWGRVKTAAAKHGDNMASWHMIDFTRRYRPDQVAALLFPYHTFTTRTGRNLAERILTQAGVRHAMDIEGAFFEEQNGDPAKQYVDMEIGGKRLRFYTSISGYTMGMYNWNQDATYQQQQQIDGPLGAIYATEKNLGTGAYPFIDFADAGVRDPYWEEHKGDYTVGGIAGVAGRAFGQSFMQMPWSQTMQAITQMVGATVGMDKIPSWMMGQRLVDDVSRRLAAKVQNGEITEVQALYAGAILDSSVNGRPLPPQMTAEQIAAAEKLLSGTVWEQGVNTVATRLASDILGVTAVNLTPGRQGLPDLPTYAVAKPGDVAQLPDDQYSAYNTRLTTMTNAGMVSEADATALRSWLQAARQGKPGALPQALQPILAQLNQSLTTQANAQRRTELQTGVPMYSDPSQLGLSEAQSLYAATGYPNNELGGRTAQAGVRALNPGITTYWMRFNIKEPDKNESPGITARRTEYFAAADLIYGERAKEVTDYILKNSGRYVPNAEIAAIDDTYQERISALKTKYADVLAGTAFEKTTRGMNPHERAVHELVAILEYDGEKPPYPTPDMTPEQRVDAFAAREKWDNARLDYIERTLQQFDTEPNQEAWRQLLTTYVQGEYASELVRKYINLKYAGRVERQWDGFASVEREMQQAGYQANEQNLLDRLGPAALRKWQIYQAQDDNLTGDSGAQAKRKYADSNPEIAAARVAMYNPDAYDAGVSLFGQQMWTTYAAYKNQKPEYPGENASTEALAAYYDKLNALDARYPQAAEIQFWVEGRYRWWEAYGTDQVRSSDPTQTQEGGYGGDYAQAQALFGPDIFETWLNIPRSSKKATAQYYDAHPELEAFNAWRRQYSELPDSPEQLQQLDINVLEQAARDAGQLQAPVPASFMTQYGMYAGPRPVGSDRQPINETLAQRQQRLILEAQYQQYAAQQAQQAQIMAQGGQAAVSDPQYTIDPYTGGGGGGGGYSGRRYYSSRRRGYSGRRYYGGGGGGGGYGYGGGGGAALDAPQIRRLYPDRVDLQGMNPILWESLLRRFFKPGA